MDKQNEHFPGAGPAPQEREITMQPGSLSDDEIGALLAGPARAMVEAHWKPEPMVRALEQIQALCAAGVGDKIFGAVEDIASVATRALTVAKGETP